MKKVFLIISIGCMMSVTASLAQTSASVLSPSAPTLKFSMSDSDPSTDANGQTQTTTLSRTINTTSFTATTDKKVVKTADDDSDHISCTRDGCTHHHKKEMSTCKKDEKPEPKPTFMQDPNTPNQ